MGDMLRFEQAMENNFHRMQNEFDVDMHSLPRFPVEDRSLSKGGQHAMHNDDFSSVDQTTECHNGVCLVKRCVNGKCEQHKTEEGHRVPVAPALAKKPEPVKEETHAKAEPINPAQKKEEIVKSPEQLLKDAEKANKAAQKELTSEKKEVKKVENVVKETEEKAFVKQLDKKAEVQQKQQEKDSAKADEKKEQVQKDAVKKAEESQKKADEKTAEFKEVAKKATDEKKVAKTDEKKEAKANTQPA